MFFSTTSRVRKKGRRKSPKTHGQDIICTNQEKRILLKNKNKIIKRGRERERETGNIHQLCQWLFNLLGYGGLVRIKPVTDESAGLL